MELEGWETIGIAAVFLLLWFIDPIIKATIFHLGSLTKTVKVIRFDQNCPTCEGDGSFIHPVAGHVQCRCYGSKPQKVIHPRLSQHIEELGMRMGMGSEKSRRFSNDFADFANSYLDSSRPILTAVDGSK